MIAGAIVILAAALIGAALLFVFRDDGQEATKARYVVVSKEESALTSPPDATTSSVPSQQVVASGSAEGSVEPAVGESAQKAVVSHPGKPRKPDPQYFTQVFARRQGAVQQCVTSSGEEEMRVQISFKVDTAGRVTSATLSPSSVSASTAGQCILRVARSVSFGPLTEDANFRIPVTASKH
jgi:TonB family protein